MYKKDKLTAIRKIQQNWEEKFVKQFENETKREFLTESGIPLKRVYTPLDLADKGYDYPKDTGFPGEYPYVAGITPTMYRSQMWGVSQYTGYPTPKESNEWWKVQIELAGHTCCRCVYPSVGICCHNHNALDAAHSWGLDQ